MEKVGEQYKKIGVLLLNDTSGTITQSFVNRYHHDIMFAIFTKWVQGKGRLPVQWDTLVEVLKNVGLLEVANEIERKKL